MNPLGKLLPKSAQDRIHLWRLKLRDRILWGKDPDVRNAIPERFVRIAYQVMLRRNADPDGWSHRAETERAATVLRAGQPPRS